MILMNTSYYEIGGKIVECVLHQESANSPSFGRPFDELGVMIVEKAVVGVATKALDKIKRKPSIEERGIEALESVQDSHRKKLGKTMMRWSVGVALMPDPIPLVDEVLLAGTFAVGAYLYASD